VYKNIDIVDKTNKHTGQTATFEEVRSRGLWVRGVHALVYTSGKRIVMQKRSKEFDYHPGDIEISVGGGVDAGETPLRAAQREVSEELGLDLPARSFVPVECKKFSHRYKSQGHMYYKRVFIYSYKVCIDEATLRTIRPRDGEATELFILTKRQALAAIRRHWVRGYGRLMPMYAYWYRLVRSIDS
jgi:8-oxo-dGTP pyrophosphatase MutT (NUDIX family)